VAVVKDLFYQALMFLAKRWGNWIFLLPAWCVATGYFLFFPRRVVVSIRFFRSLFPESPSLHALGCAWRQYHHFVHVFLDRFLMTEDAAIRTTYEGWEHLVAAVESGKGGIILMSHVGSWEIAAHLLKHHGRNHPGMKLLLYLGAKHREQIERRQKQGIERSGIRVIAVPEDGGSPMEIVEGLNFLREGGMVSLAGDRLWGRNQRAVTVRFAGGEARIPETPFILALLSGAPLLVFFVYRTGRGQYHLLTRPPLYVTAASRKERRAAVEKAAQIYADFLVETARTHPDEWYHFEPFLTGRGERADAVRS
jgi:predicted LPLAT superfamily acyltransferase